MIVHNEYLGWQIEWSQTMQDTLYEISQDDDVWDKFRDFIQEKFPNVDTFHTDCVTFLYAFESMEDARNCEKEMKNRIRAWIKAYC